MYVAMFDAEGVAVALMSAPEGAVVRTAERHGWDWREIDRETKAVEDVPALTYFPSRD